MKTIIAGSRNIEIAPSFMQQIVEESGFKITELVTGKAKGIDKSGEAWARSYGELMDHQIKGFPAMWDLFGNAAGPIRNSQMANYAEALIAIPHPVEKSSGTHDMIYKAKKNGLKVYVHHMEDYLRIVENS
jgi:hypothetical protein